MGRVQELSDGGPVEGHTQCQDMGNVEGFQAIRATLKYSGINSLSVTSPELGDGLLDGGQEGFQTGRNSLTFLSQAQLMEHGFLTTS